MKRMLSLLLLVVMAAAPVKAGSPPTAGETLSLTQAEETECSEEILKLREKNSETFHMPDGSYECVVYADDKYYEDETGSLALIDNSVVSASFSYGGRKYGFANKANSTRVYFSEEAPSVMIASGKASLAFEVLSGAEAVYSVGGLGKGTELANHSLFGENFFAYENAFEHTDLVYRIGNGYVKEYMVLNDPDAPTEFSFVYDTEGYTAEYTENGGIGFFDTEGEPAFELGSLFAVDSAEAYTEELSYHIGETANGRTEITVSLSAEFAQAPEREYPIMIDPSVMISGSDKTQDSFVSSKNPTSNYYLDEHIRMGWNSGYNIRRTYIRFDLPSSIPSQSITQAYMSLKKYGAGSTPSLKAYRVTESWTSSTITWNNKPVSTSISASDTAEAMTNNWYRFYVTDIVRQWYAGTYQNYGFMVRDSDESGTSSWSTFYSSDAASPNKPELRITYVTDQQFTYYINNTYWGKYLHKGSGTTLNAASGLLSSLQSSIRWKANFLGNSRFTLQPEGDLTRYLFDSSSTGLSLKIPSDPANLSNNYIWEITSATSSGKIIKNVTTGKYLFEGENASVSTTDTLGSSGTILYTKHVWRVVTTDYYSNSSSSTKREFSANSSISNIEAAKNTTIYNLMVNKYYSNEIWCSLADFTFAFENTALAYAESKGTIKTNDILGGTRVTATYKVTNRVKSFILVVGYSSTISSTPIPDKITNTLSIDYNEWPAGENSSFYGVADGVRHHYLDQFYESAHDIAILGSPFVNAKAFLLHFLGNTGELYTINLKNTISSWATANAYRTEDLNNLIGVIELLGTGTETTLHLIELTPHHESEINDWKLSIGDYYTSISATFRKVGQTFTASVIYELHDAYDWDKNANYLPVSGFVITPAELWELHHGGYARHYEVFGSNTFTMTWTQGQTVGNGVVISNEH